MLGYVDPSDGGDVATVTANGLATSCSQSEDRAGVSVTAIVDIAHRMHLRLCEAMSKG